MPGKIAPQHEAISTWLNFYLVILKWRICAIVPIRRADRPEEGGNMRESGG
jgi:hypothetical protein